MGKMADWAARRELALEFVAAHSGVTSKQVGAAVGLSRKSADKMLIRMQDKGLLHAVYGNGPKLWASVVGGASRRVTMRESGAAVVLELIGQMQPASMRDVRHAAGLKEDTARQVFQALRKSGQIALVGGGLRAAWYIAGSDVHQAALAARPVDQQPERRREIQQRHRDAVRQMERVDFVHRVVSVHESGVKIPRGAFASVWDLARIGVTGAAHAAG